MITNDILRRLRFALDLNDAQAVAMITSAGWELDALDLVSYLAKESDGHFETCPDDVLRAFLDGLITERRGPRDPSAPLPPEGTLDNNLILRKLRIALNLKEPAMLALLKRGGMDVSPSELGALFRNPANKHYRVCGDQFLRAFLRGLTIEERGVDG